MNSIVPDITYTNSSLSWKKKRGGFQGVDMHDERSHVFVLIPVDQLQRTEIVIVPLGFKDMRLHDVKPVCGQFLRRIVQQFGNVAVERTCEFLNGGHGWNLTTVFYARKISFGQVAPLGKRGPVSDAGLCAFSSIVVRCQAF